MGNTKKAGQAKKNKAVVDREKQTVTFEYEGSDWTLTADAMESLELWDLIDQADETGDPQKAVRAMRVLLGDDQANRFFRGRGVRDIQPFFDRCSAELDTLDPSNGSDSSESTSGPSKPTSNASTD